MIFTVIIPLYNKENHIERAINSVLSQTYQTFEIIVIDDGSTDNGLKIVEEMADTRIKIIKKKNEGVSSARNKGIEFASTNHLGFLDADDSWKPWFLESILNLINKYPTAGAYATAYEFIGIDNKVESAEYNINLKKGDANVVDYFKATLKHPLISASSVIIPKYVFKDLGSFALDLTRGEDLEMWCKVALKYEIVFLNIVSSSYYKNVENRATQKKRVYSKSFMSRAEEFLEEQKKNENTSLYFEEYMIKIIISKARYLLQDGREKEARKLLFKYRYTKHHKKLWLKTYLLSFKPIYYIKNIKI